MSAKPKDAKNMDEERAAAYAESDIVCDDDLVIAIPKTQRAACWWGRDTRWPTAAPDGENMFQAYDRDGPLTVFVIEGKKYQFYAGSGYFMDEADRRVPWKAALDTVRKRLETDFPALLAVLSYEFGTSLRNVLDEDPHASTAGGQNALAILRESIERYGNDLHALEKEHWTPNLAAAAIGRGQTLLHHLPPAAIDRSVCVAAVRKPDDVLAALREAPDEFLDRDLVEIAIESKARSVGVVMRRRPELIDRALLDRALEIDPAAIAVVPHDRLTEEIVARCVEKDPYLVREVPPDLLTSAVCRKAVGRHPALLKSIPYSLIDSDICRVVIENPNLFREVPQEFLTVEFCCDVLDGAIEIAEAMKLKRHWLSESHAQQIPKVISLIPLEIAKEVARLRPDLADLMENHGLTFSAACDEEPSSSPR